MYAAYRDRAEFFIVYIREAHPTDGRQVPQNRRDGVEIKSPATEKEREGVAGTCLKDLKLTIPCLLDDMKDTAEKAYAGWPDRFYVVDVEGKIAYKGDPGPRGFKPDLAEAALKKLLPERAEKAAEKSKDGAKGEKAEDAAAER
jgi:hypothetical protein